MDHQIEYALRLNLRVVNLDLVGLRERARGRGHQADHNPRQRPDADVTKEFQSIAIYPQRLPRATLGQRGARNFTSFTTAVVAGQPAQTFAC